MSKAPAVTAPYADPKGEFPFDVATYLFHLFVVVAAIATLARSGAQTAWPQRLAPPGESRHRPHAALPR